MTPYYEAGGVTIYHGDCREILPQIPRGSCDALITDPPYGVRWRSGLRGASFAAIAGDDSTDAAIEGIRLALPAIKDFGHCYAFGRYDLAAAGVESKVVELIWDKCQIGPGDLSSPWGPQHEPIAFWVKTNTGAVARNRGAGPARRRKGSVLRIHRLNACAVSRHPTEKPVALMRELIESSTRIGETVLDPFMGVGSTLVAAMAEGRRAIGIELDEGYCEAAAERLRQCVLPMWEAL